MNVKTKKKNLYIETFMCKTYMEVDIVKEIDNKILIKTWRGFAELTLNEKENCWIITNEYDKFPEDWEWLYVKF